MDLEQLFRIFPQKLKDENDSICDTQHEYKTEETDKINTDILNEIQNYEPYIVICKDTMHANQIKKLIITTSQQILCTFND